MVLLYHTQAGVLLQREKSASTALRWAGDAVQANELFWEKVDTLLDADTLKIRSQCHGGCSYETEGMVVG